MKKGEVCLFHKSFYCWQNRLSNLESRFQSSFLNNCRLGKQIVLRWFRERLAAVSALPFNRCTLLENISLSYVLEKLQVSSLVISFHFGYRPKSCSCFFESFFSAMFPKFGYSVPHSNFSPSAEAFRFCTVVPIVPAGMQRLFWAIEVEF